jgi:PKD repeat protein
MKKLLVFCLFLLYISANAQPKYFEKNLAWEAIHNGRVIFEKADGNFFVACDVYSLDNNSWHQYNLNLDKFGNIVDNIHLDLPNGYNIAVIGGITTEYGYSLVGYMGDMNMSRACLLQINIDGQLMDSLIVGQNHSTAYTLSRTPDGGYMLGGSVRQYSGNNFTTYPYLIRLNEQGEVVWDTMYQLPLWGGETSSFRTIIASTTDDTYYVNGRIRSFDENDDVIWLHINGQDGEIIDYRIWGNEQSGTKQSTAVMLHTSDGGWLIPYMLNQSGDVVSGQLIKYNAENDSVEWQREIFNWGFITLTKELPDGSFIVGGEASPLPDYAFNAAIAHVSSTGDVLWQRSYGGAGDDDYIYDFTPTSDGGYFFVGRTETNVPGANVYLLKTNCMGLLTEPIANYSYTNPNGNTIAFQNLSQYTYPDSLDGGHYLWDFGDGFNSNEQNPTHTYAQAGIYLAKLTAIVCQDTSIMYQSICIGTSAHPAPSFTHTLQNDTLVSFTNTSSNAQNAVFIWDFGDGSPPTQTITQQALQHSYTQAGEHQVTLSVIMCQDTTVYTQVVDTWAVGMQVLPLEGGLEGGLCTVLPNPANEQISIYPPSGGWGVQTHTFVLYDVLGKAVARQALNTPSFGGGKGEATIATKHLPSGIYLYQIINPQNQTLQHGKLSILH